MPARWRGSSRRISRSRWPTRFCSASWQNGGTARVLLEVDEATGTEKLAFRYLSRDEEKALPRPPERKALPRVGDGDAKRRPPKKPGRAITRKPEPA